MPIKQQAMREKNACSPSYVPATAGAVLVAPLLPACDNSHGPQRSSRDVNKQTRIPRYS